MTNKHLYQTQVGSIIARLTKSEEEIYACQRLRYQVFFEEQGAQSGAEEDPRVHTEKRDFDQFDATCNHIIMFDSEKEGSWDDKIVGTYRLIEKEHISEIGHFFSEYEFTVDSLKEYNGRVMELGRACIKKEYRNNIVMKMLWNVIADYFFKNDIKLMFGEADWATTDLSTIIEPLSFLKHYYETKEMNPALKVVKSKQQTWDQVEGLIPADKLDMKSALNKLEPLMKGYLRLGCNIADGIFVDPKFNSTSIVILLDMDKVDKKYFEHYSKKQED